MAPSWLAAEIGAEADWANGREREPGTTHPTRERATGGAEPCGRSWRDDGPATFMTPSVPTIPIGDPGAPRSAAQPVQKRSYGPRGVPQFGQALTGASDFGASIGTSVVPFKRHFG